MNTKKKFKGIHFNGTASFYMAKYMKLLLLADAWAESSVGKQSIYIKQKYFVFVQQEQWNHAPSNIGNEEGLRIEKPHNILRFGVV